MSDISKNIKFYRKKHGLSQEQLAAELHVTRQTISNWETDKSYPDLDMVIRLSEILETDPNHLLYPEAPRKKAVLQTVSFKPIIAVFLLFLFSMTFGSGFSGYVFSKIVGGGVSETYLYPIYGGVILLAVLVTVCTCLIIEEIRNQGQKDD